MGQLDDILNNQQKLSKDSVKQEGSSLLRKVSTCYVWLGGISIVLGLLLFIVSFSDDNVTESIVGGSMFFSGLFTLFGGCIGKAVDDIRNALTNNK